MPDSISHNLAPLAATGVETGNGPASQKPAKRRENPVPRPVEKVDTTPHDTVAAFNPAQVRFAMQMPPGQAPVGVEAHGGVGASSWIILGLALLLVAIALKARGSMKYAVAMWHTLTRGRRPRAMFDDTMRETTFSLLLQTLCLAGAVVLLCAAFWGKQGMPLGGAGLTHALGVCALGAGALYMFRRAACWTAGTLFYDRALRGEWLKAFTASESLLGLALLPAALLVFLYPGLREVLLLYGLGAWVMSRIMFIIKGLRIFPRRGGGAVAIFYYLCGVEIVPAILAVRGVAASL